MPTFAVLMRSFLAFVVLAALALIGFVVSDTRALNQSVSPQPPSTLADVETSPEPTTGPDEAVRPETSPTETLPTDTPPPELLSIDQIPQSGTGAFIPARTTAGVTVGSGNIIEFSVAAEQGTGVNPDELAQTVDLVLADDRSWIAEGNLGFRRIETGGLFTLVVATADTVDQLCAPLRTNGVFSCARNGWVALNLNRWMLATDTWTADLDEYRTYVINHEVGHYLARPHVGCPGLDQLAPVMMQQTKGLGECQPNGWPYPFTG